MRYPKLNRVGIARTLAVLAIPAPIIRKILEEIEPRTREVLDKNVNVPHGITVYY